MKTALFNNLALAMLFEDVRSSPSNYFIEQPGFPNLLLVYFADVEKTRIYFDAEVWGIDTTEGCTFSFQFNAQGNFGLLESDGYLSTEDLKTVLTHFYQNAAFYEKAVLMVRDGLKLRVYKSKSL